MKSIQRSKDQNLIGGKAGTRTSQFRAWMTGSLTGAQNNEGLCLQARCGRTVPGAQSTGSQNLDREPGCVQGGDKATLSVITAPHHPPPAWPPRVI